MIKFKDGDMLIPPLLFQRFIMAFKKNGQIVLPKEIYDELGTLFGPGEITNRSISYPAFFWRDIPIVCEK